MIIGLLTRTSESIMDPELYSITTYLPPPWPSMYFLPPYIHGCRISLVVQHELYEWVIIWCTLYVEYLAAIIFSNSLVIYISSCIDISLSNLREMLKTGKCVVCNLHCLRPGIRESYTYPFPLIGFHTLIVMKIISITPTTDVGTPALRFIVPYLF